MIADGKPAHWPKMLDVPQGEGDQAAVRTLAEVRRLIVAYRRSSGVPDEFDWRIDHALTDHLVNVVSGLIADAKAIDAHCETEHKAITPLREANAALKEQLAESKRPFTAQMEMQNKRIIGLNAEIDRLTAALRAFLAIDFSPSFDAKGFASQRKADAVNEIRYGTHKEACERAQAALSPPGRQEWPWHPGLMCLCPQCSLKKSST